MIDELGRTNNNICLTKSEVGKCTELDWDRVKGEFCSSIVEHFTSAYFLD
jgi:hypothetical protein